MSNILSVNGCCVTKVITNVVSIFTKGTKEAEP